MLILLMIVIAFGDATPLRRIHRLPQGKLPWDCADDVNCRDEKSSITSKHILATETQEELIRLARQLERVLQNIPGSGNDDSANHNERQSEVHLSRALNYEKGDDYAEDDDEFQEDSTYNDDDDDEICHGCHNRDGNEDHNNDEDSDFLVFVML